MKHLTEHSNQSGDDQMNFTPLWTAALNAFSNFIIVDERCRIAYMNKPYTEILNIKLEGCHRQTHQKHYSDHKAS